MKNLMKLFYLVNYLLLIAPPRAIDLTINERARKGELANQSLIVVLVVELMIRVAVILLLATGLEILIGDRWYEGLHLDLVFQMVVFSGCLHSTVYYLLLGLLRSAFGLANVMRWYRLMRNGCYSLLPGLVAVSAIHAWQLISRRAVIPEDGLYHLYFMITAAMVIVGVIEALAMHRQPRWLDKGLTSPSE